MLTIDAPSSQIHEKEAAVDRLIEVRAFSYLIELVKDTWKPVAIREKALEAISINPKGNENFLFSIVTDWYELFQFRKMALNGLIQAESKSHLLKIVDGLETPEWMRKLAVKALK